MKKLPAVRNSQPWCTYGRNAKSAVLLRHFGLDDEYDSQLEKALDLAIVGNIDRCGTTPPPPPM